MELLKSYLKTVGKGLPEAQREDILRELSEDIRAEMEEKSAELGRPLTKDEQQAVLKQRGNPLLLAARYRQDTRALVIGRELIGPALFPFYVKVLSFNLGLTFIIITIIFAALVASGQHVSFREIFSTALLQLFIQLGAVTLIFSLIQRSMNQNPDRWGAGEPGGLHLPQIRESFDFGRGRKDATRVSVAVASAVALVWLKEVQLHPFLIFGPAASFLRLGPIWSEVIPLIAVVTGLEMLRAIVSFIRPDWKRFHAVARLVTASAQLGITLVVLKAGSWFTLAATATSPGFAHAVQLINGGFRFCMVASAVIAGVEVVKRFVRVVREARTSTAGSSAGILRKR
jgi:hypothetical protein